MATLQERITALDFDKALVLGAKLVVAGLFHPEIFCEEGHDKEQLAWFDKELKKLGK